MVVLEFNKRNVSIYFILIYIFYTKKRRKVHYEFPKGVKIGHFEAVFFFQFMKVFLFCLKKS